MISVRKRVEILCNELGYSKEDAELVVGFEDPYIHGKEHFVSEDSYLEWATKMEEEEEVDELESHVKGKFYDGPVASLCKGTIDWRRGIFT